MRPISLPSLVLASLVALPFTLAVADDAPPRPPAPPPREDAPRLSDPPVLEPARVGIRYFVHDKSPHTTVSARWLAGVHGVLLRADGTPVPPGARVEPSPRQAPKPEAAPPGIVPFAELPARIAAARAAGREQEAVELQAALDALSREQEGTDAGARIVWIGAGETLRGERLTVDEQELPPGTYAVVRSELGPRTLRATLRVTGGSKVTVGGWGTRYETIAANGDRTIRFLEAPDRHGISIGGARVQVPTHPTILPGAVGQPFTVTRNADGTNSITFTTAPGPTRSGPGLSTAIEELRAEIRALREEICALRTALEGSPGPK